MNVRTAEETEMLIREEERRTNAEILEQFESYLKNQIGNPFIPDDERVEFKEVYSMKKESLYVIAETDAGTVMYEYSSYFTYIGGDSHRFDFTRIDEKFF